MILDWTVITEGYKGSGVDIPLARGKTLCDPNEDQPKRIDYIEKACRLHCGIFRLLLRVTVKGYTIDYLKKLKSLK